MLRGINVGGKHKVEMKNLVQLFEEIGFTNVKTYINSGNVIFDSKLSIVEICDIVEAKLRLAYDFEIPILVITQDELKKNVNSIPEQWLNSDIEKTDVAFLFPEVDNENIIDNLPFNLEFIDVRYKKGVMFYNVTRENQKQSNLDKVILHKLFRKMTVRNINTVRYLANC